LEKDAVVLQILSQAEVVYSGRAASTADAGDLLVILKGDGSLQVQSQRGVRPVNWQPQTDLIEAFVEDGSALLVSERHSPLELVRVLFLQPHLAQAFRMEELTGFVLMGSEREMQEAL